MLVESSMMALGTIAPDFTLLDTRSNNYKSLSDLQSDKGTVVLFICNHCPYVHHVNQKLIEMAHHYISKGIAFIAISSNNIETHPQDGPEQMRDTAQKLGYPFAYLYDESQEVAKAYKAECTPDFYLFDNQMRCFYRGRFDATRPGTGSQATGVDLSNALDLLLLQKEGPKHQYPSMGCNIKWK